MVPTKIGRRLARHQAAFEGKAATDIEMQAALSWARTTRYVGPAIARELGRDPKTIQDYGNPNTDDRGPHLILLYTSQLALEMKGNRDEALAALDFVEQQLGRVAIDLPTTARPATAAERSKRIAFAVLQLGEFLELASLDHLTPEQATRVHQEKQDVVRALEELFPSAPVPAPDPNEGAKVTAFVRGGAR